MPTLRQQLRETAMAGWRATIFMPPLISAALLGGAAQAQDAKSLQARTLAAGCAACHGTNGRPVDAAGPVPGLAGMPAATLVEQMKAFKSGARQATVMPQLAKGFSDAQIERLAAYFAAQAKP
jgi:cytochrome c553